MVSYPRTYGELISVREAARKHRVADELIRSWVRAGKLPIAARPFKGATSAHYFQPEDVAALVKTYRAYVRAKALARARPKRRPKPRRVPANVCRVGLEADGSESIDPITQVQACRFLTPADHAEIGRRRAKFEARRGTGNGRA